MIDPRTKPSRWQSNNLVFVCSLIILFVFPFYVSIFLCGWNLSLSLSLCLSLSRSFYPSFFLFYLFISLFFLCTFLPSIIHFVLSSFLSLIFLFWKLKNNMNNAGRVLYQRQINPLTQDTIDATNTMIQSFHFHTNHYIFTKCRNRIHHIIGERHITFCVWTPYNNVWKFLKVSLMYYSKL